MSYRANMASLSAFQSILAIDTEMNPSLEGLSAHLRINQGPDSDSGSGIADALKTHGFEISRAIDNARAAVAGVQAAERMLERAVGIVKSLNTKTVQASSGPQTLDTRAGIQAEISPLFEMLAAIVRDTGESPLALPPYAAAAAELISSMALSNISVMTQKDARAGIEISEAALEDLGTARSSLGAVQSQLEHTILSLIVTQANVRSAASFIREVDFAENTADAIRFSLLTRTGTYDPSHSNALSQDIMGLI